MRSLNVMLVVLAATAPASADDYESMRPRVVVLDDGKHHYLAYVREPELLHSVWFYGDDKVLHRLTVNSTRDMKRERATWQVHDPRYKRTTSEILSDFDTGEFVVTCAKRKTVLHPLAAPAAAKLLEHVKLADPVPLRLVTFFARGDQDTTYYFVDRPWLPPGEPESTDYRLWIGKRGAMRRIPIRDLATDTAGILLVTDQGKLELKYKAGTFTWLPTAGKPRPLTSLDGDNSDLIYNQLGVYANERLGTPCDDL